MKTLGEKKVNAVRMMSSYVLQKTGERKKADICHYFRPYFYLCLCWVILLTHSLVIYPYVVVMCVVTQHSARLLRHYPHNLPSCH